MRVLPLLIAACLPAGPTGHEPPPDVLECRLQRIEPLPPWPEGSGWSEWYLSEVTTLHVVYESPDDEQLVLCPDGLDLLELELGYRVCALSITGQTVQCVVLHW